MLPRPANNAATVFLFAIPVMLLASTFMPPLSHEKNVSNLYVDQAQAFLQGRLDVSTRIGNIAVYRDRAFVPFPPFPAVLLMPFVAIGPQFANSVVIASGLALLSALLLARILKKLDTDADTLPWILAAFLLGTAYWFCFAKSVGVWQFAQIVAVTCMFLAIDESLGKARGPLAGMFLGLAFLSRQLSIYAFLFIAVTLWTHPRHRTNRARIFHVITCAAALALCVAAYLAFNQARFGSIFDTGYAHMRQASFIKLRTERYGLFHPVYFYYNFVHMFLQGFHLEFFPPLFLDRIRLNPVGTSITFASPFVFFAFRARWNKPRLIAAWISVACALLHMLFYCNNGWAQTNAQRFTLDFLPILILLVARGAPRIPPTLFRGAIIYAIVLNSIAHLCIPLLHQIKLPR